MFHDNFRTPSEKRLAALAQAAFLKLWSYPNLYTNESKGPKGDGKEFCDLTVIFGNRILLFSDKHVNFSSDKPIEIAWPRWYRRAIVNSAKQLMGAESWIRRFPDRLFLDRACSTPVPLDLSATAPFHVHKIVIANGASRAVSENFKKEFSSLPVYGGDQSRANKYPPFATLQPFKDRTYIHIFDEITIGIVLRELDTIADFIDYLDARERLATVSGGTLHAAGEEDLLAIFMRAREFPTLPNIDIVYFRYGVWGDFIRSLEYKIRTEANRISYKWDELIEYFTQFILSDRNISPFEDAFPLGSIAYQEQAIRRMAAEGRMRRRQLGQWLIEGASIARELPQFARSLAFLGDENKPKRGYTLYFQKQTRGQTYNDYRRNRVAMLHGHMMQCKIIYPDVTSITGICSEGSDDPKNPGTQDLMIIDFNSWDPADEAAARRELKLLQISSDPSALVRHYSSDSEFQMRNSARKIVDPPNKKKLGWLVMFGQKILRWRQMVR